MNNIVAQILAYIVIIGITASLGYIMIRFSEDYTESDKILFSILGFISGLLGIVVSLITMILIIKYLWFCWSIIS